jgi:DNA-binding NtrC family response regulator
MFRTNPGRVLIVDDEINTLKASATILKMNGLNDVTTESDSRQVLEIMNAGNTDVVLLDLFMPHLSGMELLPLLREQHPQVPVIILTAAYEIERAVECIKAGAFDYLVKPVEPERMLITLQKAFECSVLNAQVTNLRDHLVEDRLDHPDVFEEIVSCSRKMRSIFQYLEVIAKSPQPVLITGESGTGKELVTRAIHRLSGCKGELVSVNLAGLDDTMFSDTLFGHKRGAFTGAEQLRDGLVVKAANGVILLDEIGDLGESSQIRLLRLIQEREFYPVGSDTPRKSEARIVCASNKNLKDLVASGKFRNDLFYRLNVHHVELPPLRNRKEDIPLLLDHFLAKAAKVLDKKKPTPPLELGTLLQLYSFPGNIREFEALVFDAVAQHTSGILSMECFRKLIEGEHPAAQSAPITNAATEESSLTAVFGHFPTIREVEERMINEAMALAKGNQGIAASLLGMTRQTLNNRLRVAGKAE